MPINTISMHTILVFIILMKISIDCKPIASVQNSEIESLTLTTSKVAASVTNNQKNPSRITLPNDVELIETTTKRNQQQIVIPAVDSIFELIFAVSFIIYQLKSNCDFINKMWLLKFHSPRYQSVYFKL